MFKLKSAPPDSLTCRLAKSLAIVNTECGEYVIQDNVERLGQGRLSV